MAQRFDFYFRQPVTEDELDGAFTGLEDADRAIAADQGQTGVLSGLGVAQQGTPNMTVAVGSGVAYDPLGERCRVPSTQNVDCSVDYTGITTAVAGVGNEKYLALFLLFDRVLTDPRTDGSSLTVYYNRAESYKFKLVQGAEAASGLATKPALDPNGSLLADIRIVFGTTSVTTAMIDLLTRRQDTIVASGSPHALRRGLPKDAFTDLLGWLNAHIAGTADEHIAADINYAGGGTWADGTTNPAATVEVQLDKIITDLGNAAGNGAAKIYAPASGSMPAGTVRAQLNYVENELSTLRAYKHESAYAFNVGQVILSRTANTYADVSSITVAASIGQVVRVTGTWSSDDGGDDAFYEIQWSDGGGGFASPGPEAERSTVLITNATQTKTVHHVEFMVTVVTGGAQVFKLRHKNSDNVTSIQTVLFRSSFQAHAMTAP